MPFVRSITRLSVPIVLAFHQAHISAAATDRADRPTTGLSLCPSRHPFAGIPCKRVVPPVIIHFPFSIGGTIEILHTN